MATWLTPSSSTDVLLGRLRAPERPAHLVGDAEARARGASLRAEVEPGAGRVEGGARQLGAGLAGHLQEGPHPAARGEEHQLEVAAVLAHEEVTVARPHDV